MATSVSFAAGPYLSAALLCEKVLVEQDGGKSAIRIIDRVTRTASGPSPPKVMEPFDYEVKLLIRLKSGQARGPYPLRVSLVKPSGEIAGPLQETIYFEDEDDRGVDVIGNIMIKFDREGIYWFDIYLKEVLLTRIPFRVIYVPQVKQIHEPSASLGPAREFPTG